MSTNLLDLSEKIDGYLVDFFEIVANVANSANALFFVVGAAARDMILIHGYGIESTRGTEDIDFGIQVSDWDQFKKLKNGLIATEKFNSTENPQRLSYEKYLKVDLIPFGKIADPDYSVSWPPDHQMVMSTLGFDESYHHSLTVRLRSNPIFEIKFASLSGIVLLKLISWNDHYPLSSRDRDAKDIIFIMRNYLDAGNLERLYNKEVDIVEKSGSDYDRFSARLLGRDIASITHTKTLKIILKILDRETGEQDRYRLVEDMRGTISALGDDFDERLQLLEELKAGILDRL
jgi:predicted nucleotidyltransferase